MCLRCFEEFGKQQSSGFPSWKDLVSAGCWFGTRLWQQHHKCKKLLWWMVWSLNFQEIKVILWWDIKYAIRQYIIQLGKYLKPKILLPHFILGGAGMCSTCYTADTTHSCRCVTSNGSEALRVVFHKRKVPDFSQTDRVCLNSCFISVMCNEEYQVKSVLCTVWDKQNNQI